MLKSEARHDSTLAPSHPPLWSIHLFVAGVRISACGMWFQSVPRSQSAAHDCVALSPSSANGWCPSNNLDDHRYGISHDLVSTVEPGSAHGYLRQLAQLTVALVQSDLTTGEVVQIKVTDPAPGGGTSNVMTFTINNPLPSITGLSQAGAAVGSGAITLNVSGSGFDPASVVQWNGTNLPTTFLDSSSLSATVPTTNLLQLGNYSVSVFNPAPGGGFSASLPFTTYLALPTNDLVYNPVNQLLYATVPSSAGSPLGNSIVSIDPNTGLIGAPIWVGSEPNRLALSDDGTTAWVGMLGSSTMLKADLMAGPTPVQVYFPGGLGE